METKSNSITARWSSPGGCARIYELSNGKFAIDEDGAPIDEREFETAMDAALALGYTAVAANAIATSNKWVQCGS